MIDLRQIEDQLRQHGWATCHASDLLGALWLELIGQDRPEGATVGETKKYLIKWLGEAPIHHPSSIYARCALACHPLAKLYLDVARLAYYNVWETLPTTEPPSFSQLWHQDTEDRTMLKLFVYLSDVPEGAGPLTYLPGSHFHGTVLKGRHPGHRFDAIKVRRSTDQQMADVSDPQQWQTFTGVTGDCVLVDTTGYHKGGYATTQPRIVYTCQYTTPQARIPRQGWM